MTPRTASVTSSLRADGTRRVTVSVVIVTHNEAQLVRGCLASLLPQLAPDDEIIVVDNGSSDGTPEVVEQAAPTARVVRRNDNLGYMAACNAAGALARGELLVLLNPDTVVTPGFTEAIALPLRESRGWAAWQALLTQAGGREINTSGGTTHFAGVSWATQVGEPVSALAPGPREVAFASSACLAVPRTIWEAERGFPEAFFLYFDDVDLSLRLRLIGGLIGIEPAARVDHLYDFSRRALKWRLLGDGHPDLSDRAVAPARPRLGADRARNTGSGHAGRLGRAEARGDARCRARAPAPVVRTPRDTESSDDLQCPLRLLPDQRPVLALPRPRG